MTRAADRRAFVRELFDTVAAGYDTPALRFFPANAEALAAYIDPAPGTKVLDAATGTGAVALALAERQPAAQVLGIDFSEGMLAQARRKASQRGLGNVAFRCMDLDASDLPDGHFDAATCAFGIFFLDDMTEGLRTIANAVRSGGLVATAGFCENLFRGPGEQFLTDIRRFGIEPPPPVWRQIAGEVSTADLFRAAGLTATETRVLSLGYHLPDPAQWWEVLWNAGYRGLLSQLAPEDLLRFREEHLAAVAALAGPGGLRIEVDVVQARGRRA